MMYVMKISDLAEWRSRIQTIQVPQDQEYYKSVQNISADI